MPGSPTYSIANCVVETGQRLRATAGIDLESAQLRAAGRALLSAEVLGFRHLDDESKKFGSQGLEVELGFYDSAVLEVIRNADDRVCIELAYSIGGYLHGFQIKYSLLSRTDDWLISKNDWSESQQFRHLDWKIDAVTGTNLLGSLGETRILARRMRYRLGVDFGDGSRNAFWWSTPQTEEWLARIAEKDTLDSSTRRDLNGCRRSLKSSPLARLEN